MTQTAFCWASDHPAGCRVPDSRAPSRCSPSGHQPGLRVQRCTHAGIEEEKKVKKGQGEEIKEQKMWMITFDLQQQNVKTFVHMNATVMEIHRYNSQTLPLDGSKMLYGQKRVEAESVK